MFDLNVDFKPFLHEISLNKIKIIEKYLTKVLVNNVFTFFFIA
jgi:hypothetical protein